MFVLLSNRKSREKFTNHLQFIIRLNLYNIVKSVPKSR